MQAVASSALVLFVFMCLASAAAAQPPVGALAIDVRQGDRYGWAVDYETAGAARAAALRECGAGCSVVLMFERCAAYAADQDADSTAVGLGRIVRLGVRGSADGAVGVQFAGRFTGCIVRVWGCNGPVVEEGLGLDRGARQQIQRSLQAAGFDLDGADGMFGPRTRAAIRSWQSSRGVRATGYLDAASAAELRSAASGPAVVGRRAACGAAAAGDGGAGDGVLAVDREQHEPGGVRGVSGAVPERGVPGAGRGPLVVATRFRARVGGHRRPGLRRARRRLPAGGGR